MSRKSHLDCRAAGYHARKDLALILDVARFKYPPHWVSAERLWRAMERVDPTTGQSRGWIVIRRRAAARTIDHSACCVREGAV
ncbi:MAG: hypothetical protein FP825_05375 [Hyphomonas sp.]|uniref:phytochelatin synthase family protein n=1 Tax=Hyphomonas sp. TaxID=87 RepID=UPI0018333C08|nr:hypothetical protein [Hyphomonas sp.]MBU3919401.1 phytochelatin synthase family protein [Alphaproteobacteria bacterium]MBU4165514.1 phytochelatin synthase family protein [Alphaproteobacteria bacterium]